MERVIKDLSQGLHFIKKLKTYRPNLNNTYVHLQHHFMPVIPLPGMYSLEIIRTVYKVEDFQWDDIIIGKTGNPLDV